MNKLSECCEARLINYNSIWRDGVCSKCDEHSPELGDHKEELTEV